jgi:hypothetical protein
MKYLKIFEEFNSSELATLQDLLDPEYFGVDDGSLEMYTEAAIETCKMLGIEPPPDVARLHELGLIDQRDLMDSLPLDSVVEVFNILALTHQNEPRVREFCRRFPGILAYDPDTDEYRRPESSREIEEIFVDSPEYGDEVRVVLFEDKNGLRAVEWEDQAYLGYFMLRRDLESAQPSK